MTAEFNCFSLQLGAKAWVEIILLSPNKGELPAFGSLAVFEEPSLEAGGFAFSRVVRLKPLFMALAGRFKGQVADRIVTQ